MKLCFNLYPTHCYIFIFNYIHTRALCELIGEKTNVYSLEVSMWGHDVKVRKELSKRELQKLGLKDDQKMPLEDKTISYTKEDCKSTIKCGLPT